MRRERVVVFLLPSFCIYCGLAATWSSPGTNQPADHVTPTTARPFILLYQPHPLSRRLFFFLLPFGLFFFPLTLSLSLSLSVILPLRRRLLSLFFSPPFFLCSRLLFHFPSSLLPNAHSSDLASLCPTPSIYSLLQLSTHLSIERENNNKQLTW